MGRMRMLILVAAAFVPTVAAAQQPCTTDARQVVDRIYRQILNRPSDGTAASFATQLSRQGATVRDVIDRIVTSDVYARQFVPSGRTANRNGAYDRAVDTLYRKLMNRSPSASDRSYYSRIANEEGFPAAVDEILGSRAYEEQFGDWRVPGTNIAFCGDSRIAANRGSRDRYSDERYRRDNGFTSDDRFRGDSRDDYNRRGSNSYRGSRDTVGTSGRSVVVSAAQPWTDTGIDVRSGDRLLMDASGSAKLSPDANDMAAPNGSTINRLASGAPMKDRPAGALIGRIGNGPAFFVGSQGTIDARANGRLYLAVNDDYFNDNSGEYRVTIDIR